MKLSPELIQKYNTPAPRYTSYPTVPLWENNMDGKSWEGLVEKAFQLYGKEEGITLYIHLPFCESLCTYCGCNKRITKNHGVEYPYILALLNEWNKYQKILGEKPKLAGIHLGGGTPTFFSPDNLYFLLGTIIDDCEVLPNKEFSFEGHPNNTSHSHLETLAELGFDRVSYGIQDFDPQVQKAIHRIQPLESVEKAVVNARELGYQSINFDLIYGLPFQTISTMTETFEAVKSLQPDRIAFYSYAHVPSSFPAQKSYEKDLPNELEKREMYEFGKEMLLKVGYVEIGMDHFAKSDDSLNLAKEEGELHRNFMGYTTSPSKMLLGLGASSISDIYIGYAQNTKSIETYQSELKDSEWSIIKGHQLTEQDVKVKELILDLICNHGAVIEDEIWDSIPFENQETIRKMETEGLLNFKNKLLSITEMGVAVVRNICMQFDLRMIAKKSEKLVFSKSI